MNVFQRKLKIYRDNYAVESYREQMLAETEEDLKRAAKRLSGSGVCPPLYEEITLMLERIRSIKESVHQEAQRAVEKIEEIMVIELNQKGLSYEEIAEQTDIALEKVKEIAQGSNRKDA